MPNIFTQIFTILGLVERNVEDSEDKNLEAALSLVYELLSSKQSPQYSAVLTAVNNVAEEYQIDGCRPQRISDRL